MRWRYIQNDQVSLDTWTGEGRTRWQAYKASGAPWPGDTLHELFAYWPRNTAALGRDYRRGKLTMRRIP